MFGKFVFSFLFTWGVDSFAAQKGTVVVDEAYVYLNPDFDAPVISTLTKGEVLEMSNKPQGPFYKVRMKNKKLGWVSSVDIKPGVVDLSKEIKKEQKEKKEKEESKAPLESHTDELKALNTFAVLRYHGIFAQNMDWKEKTLGKTRKDNLTFFGWHMSGFDTLVEGPFFIDTRVMASFQAPDYYKKVTGYEATGWIVKVQTSFVSANPVGDNFLYHYGMGVSGTLSHFEASILKSGARSRYTLDDLNMGVVFPIGFSYRIGIFSAQVFYQYYIEKTQSSGISLGLGWNY